MPIEAAATAVQVMHRRSFADVNMDPKRSPLESSEVMSVDPILQASVIDMSSRNSLRSAAAKRPQSHTDSESDGESSSGSTSTGTRGGVPGSPSPPKALYKQHFPYPASMINGAIRQQVGRPMRPFKPYATGHEFLPYAGFVGAASLHPYAALSMRMGMTPLPTMPPMTQGLAPHLMTLAHEATKRVPSPSRLDPSSERMWINSKSSSSVSSPPNMDREMNDTASTTTVTSGKLATQNGNIDNSHIVESVGTLSTDSSSIPSTSSSTHSSLPAPTLAPSSLSHMSSRAAVASPSDRLVGSMRKRRSLPDELKDQSYWERRRKNNDAAKRSRDARKAKEEEVAIRAALLEQENIRLRVEVAALKEETARLRCLLYNS